MAVKTVPDMVAYHSSMAGMARERGMYKEAARSFLHVAAEIKPTRETARVSASLRNAVEDIIRGVDDDFRRHGLGEVQTFSIVDLVMAAKRLGVGEELVREAGAYIREKIDIAMDMDCGNVIQMSSAKGLRHLGRVARAFGFEDPKAFGSPEIEEAIGRLLRKR